jgi:hypothetical protein
MTANTLQTSFFVVVAVSSNNPIVILLPLSIAQCPYSANQYAAKKKYSFTRKKERKKEREKMKRNDLVE